jgi:hypothetical protein
MGAILTDFLPISRAGTNYKVTFQDVLNLIQANLGTNQFEVADIAARNALATAGTVSLGDRVRVLDATADGTVTTGWAIYSFLAPGWLKIIEQEGIDVAGAPANLAYTPGAGGGTITNSNGTGFNIPLGTDANAGFLAPSQFTKLAWIGVTQAVDLDALESASHAAVTTAGSAANNPIVVTGQALSFSIGGLDSAP